MIQLKKTFEDILDYAYPDSEKLDMYKKVFVETIDETRKSFHGDYNGSKNESLKYLHKKNKPEATASARVH